MKRENWIDIALLICALAIAVIAVTVIAPAMAP